MNDPMMPLPAVAAEPTSVPPAVLLANHLKALKLPTFVREYEKVALAQLEQCFWKRHFCSMTCTHRRECYHYIFGFG